jgi:hypothetical protein
VDREKITVYRLLTPFDEEKMDHDPENAPIEYDDEEIEHDVEQDYLNKMAMYEEEEQS